MRRTLVYVGFLTALLLIGIDGRILVKSVAAAPSQPKIEARSAKLLNIGSLTFKDLNKNGVLDKYEDWRLPVDEVTASLTTNGYLTKDKKLTTKALELLGA